MYAHDRCDDGDVARTQYVSHSIGVRLSAASMLQSVSAAKTPHSFGYLIWVVWCRRPGKGSGEEGAGRTGPAAKTKQNKLLQTRVCGGLVDGVLYTPQGSEDNLDKRAKTHTSDETVFHLGGEEAQNSHIMGHTAQHQHQHQHQHSTSTLKHHGTGLHTTMKQHAHARSCEVHRPQQHSPRCWQPRVVVSCQAG